MPVRRSRTWSEADIRLPGPIGFAMLCRPEMGEAQVRFAASKMKFGTASLGHSADALMLDLGNESRGLRLDTARAVMGEIKNYPVRPTFLLLVCHLPDNPGSWPGAVSNACGLANEPATMSFP